MTPRGQLRKYLNRKSHVILVQTAPLTPGVEEEWVQVVTPTPISSGVLILRRSPRLAPMIDTSPLLALPEWPDKVSYTEDGKERCERRVMVSRAALAQWGNRRSFGVISRSILRCSDADRIAPSPELRFPLDLKLSSFVKDELGLFARCDIPIGCFVVEYLGEYFFQSEWDEARRGLYAWAIDPHFGEGAHVLDAFEYRNEGAYVNHSCNANLEVVLTNRGQDGCMPGVVFRSRLEIFAGDELTVPYYFKDDLQPHYRSRILVKCTCRFSGCSGGVFIGSGGI